MTTPGVIPLGFVDEGLGNSSYFVDLGDGRALVVDPTRHPAGYLVEADRRGLDVAFAAETHSCTGDRRTSWTAWDPMYDEL